MLQLRCVNLSSFDVCLVFVFSLQEQCGSYTFIPYVVSPQGKVFACDASMMTGIKELMQPSFQLEPLLTPLVESLVHLLSNVHIQSRSGLSQQDETSDYTRTCLSLELFDLAKIRSI